MASVAVAAATSAKCHNSHEQNTCHARRRAITNMQNDNQYSPDDSLMGPGGLEWQLPPSASSWCAGVQGPSGTPHGDSRRSRTHATNTATHSSGLGTALHSINKQTPTMKGKTTVIGRLHKQQVPKMKTSNATEETGWHSPPLGLGTGEQVCPPLFSRIGTSSSAGRCRTAVLAGTDQQ